MCPFCFVGKFVKYATNLVTKSPLDCEPSKKKAHVSPFAIFSFFSTPSKFKKYNATQVGSLEDLTLFVIKRLMPMKTIELIWVQRLTYMLSPWVVFPPKKTFVEEFCQAWLKNHDYLCAICIG
jgi:hypothetical protein